MYSLCPKSKPTENHYFSQALLTISMQSFELVFFPHYITITILNVQYIQHKNPNEKKKAIYSI